MYHLAHLVVSNAAATPSTVAQGATQNAGTTPSNLPMPVPGHNLIVVTSYIYMKSYHTFV